ncbi:MAG TPA: STAS domain-containing protein [Actinoplanes sp.]|nr:STAS domain-containing protein [Actinoplanes sp.]
MTEPSAIAPALQDGASGDPTWVIRLSGEFDITARDEPAEVLRDKAADAGVRGVTLDLAETAFLDSEAMAAMIEGYQVARAAGKRYRIVNGRGLVQRTLAVAGLLDLTDSDPPG